jgi:hypothetical protein
MRHGGLLKDSIGMLGVGGVRMIRPLPAGNKHGLVNVFGMGARRPEPISPRITKFFD